MEGRGKRRRRSNKTLNKCGSKRVSKFLETVEKGTPAKGPLCDLSYALSLSSAPGKMTLALWWASTRLATSCCHPVPTRARGWCEFHNSGQIPSSFFCHEARRTTAIRQGCHHECLPLTLEGVSAQLAVPGANCASETQSAQTEGKCLSVSDCKLHVWGHLANGAQTTPHSVIMACCQLRPHHSQLVIRSWKRCAATTLWMSCKNGMRSKSVQCFFNTL